MMVNALAIKIAIACVVITAGSGSALLIYEDNGASVGPASAGIAIIQPEAVHSTAWYVGHPDVLKKDEGRCAGDAATISQSACQNVDSADNQIGINEMEKASAQDGSSGKSGNQ
jgi:hypothetical protein